MPTRTAPTALAVVALLLAAGGGVAASPQPTPLCGVCGQTFHENVTATDATLQVRENGDVRWRVENDLAAPTASDWREHPERLDERVAAGLDRGAAPPYDPSEPSVEMADGTVTVSFVDRGAARQRLGLLVVPYLHGEGHAYRWVINADRFVVEAPAGQRVVNDPAGATVDGDRAVWTGTATDDRTAPEPGDTYVVTGSGTAADARASVATGLAPLDPGRYGTYALGLLFVAVVAFGLYTLEGTRLGRRRVAAGIAATALPYLYLVAALHPLQAGGLGGFFTGLLAVAATVLVALVGGTAMYGWAAVADRRAGGATA